MSDNDLPNLNNIDDEEKFACKWRDCDLPARRRNTHQRKIDWLLNHVFVCHLPKAETHVCVFFGCQMRFRRLTALNNHLHTVHAESIPPKKKGELVVHRYECFRFIFVLSKFVFADAFYHGEMPVQIVQMALMPIRNKMGHVLVAERVFATMNFRKYTENRSTTTKQFAICWIGILLGISIWNMYVQRGDFYFINLATFVTSCIFFVLGFAEILTLSAIHLYNLRKYQSEINFTLNERFQLSENIRTAKQLAPTILHHFLNANALNVVTFLIYFGYLDKDYQQSFAYMLMALQNSISCSCIEITVITHHPMIKRKAVVWLKNLISFAKPSSSVADSSVPMAVQNGQNLVDIRGQKLLTESEMQIYFKNLEEAWK
ncbi:hypothetical protein niasHT_033298 [Heterodera trifolii]|uniref:C2H2-type domain-containing protein n=1 Tax=Heterodera trifolii TaxID=157864 RepID=A0ABD2I8B8_9BILA